MRRLLLALGLLGAFAVPALALVNVAETLYRADGVTPRNGTVTLTWTTFVSANGHRNPAGSFTTRVTNGVFSVNVEPNDTSSPSTQYVVRYRLDGGPSPDVTEYWTCPTSSSPVLISACATSPIPISGGIFALTQIANTGATSGQCIVSNGVNWTVGNCSGYWTASGNDIYNSNTRSVLVGGSTNRNYKLDVQNSGSAGTAIFFDATASTGVTKVLVQAGAGQSTNALQTWQTLTSGQYGIIGSTGSYEYWASSGKRKNVIQSGLDNASDTCVQWNATDDLATFLIDSAICRNAAGILEINSGTATAYRDLKLRILYATSGTEPTCNSGNRGAVVLTVGAGGTADQFRVCSKDASDVYNYRSLF